jgi:type IV pilus assembly protein PilC
MPQFQFRMAQADGSVRTGVMSAPDEAGVAALMRAGGGVLLSARKVRPRRAPRVRVSRRERIVFTGHLQAAISAGVGPMEALRTFAEHVPNRGFARLLAEAAQAVERGQTLAGALERHPEAFGPLYASMVATGEESGRLDGVLERLGAYLDWQDGLVRDLKQATVYPTVVITLVIALTVFLLAFVLPRFIGIFGSAANVHIPLAARWLMAVGALFGRGWPYLLAGTAAAVTVFALVRRRPVVAAWLDRAVLRVPLFGPAIRLIRLSQLTYCLGLLLDAGVDISRALTVSRGVVENRFLAEKVGEVHDRVVAGSSITEAMMAVELLPPLTLQMVAVGEEAGSLPKSLARATEFLRREVQATLRMALAVLEPCIVVFLGIVVGGIALTIFYTLYTMIMAIGGAH